MWDCPANISKPWSWKTGRISGSHIMIWPHQMQKKVSACDLHIDPSAGTQHWSWGCGHLGFFPIMDPCHLLCDIPRSMTILNIATIGYILSNIVGMCWILLLVYPITWCIPIIFPSMLLINNPMMSQKKSNIYLTNPNWFQWIPTFPIIPHQYLPSSQLRFS